MTRPRHYLFLAAFLVLAAQPITAQRAYELIKEDPQRAGGVFNMYSFDNPVAAPAPKGYKPFYISHYGRHGARYSSSNTEFETLHMMLAKGEADGMLTDLGKEFKAKYDPWYPSLRYRGGDLSVVGQQQQHLLAKRMYENYPQVFKGRPAKIDARSTTTPRCVMTMGAFCDGLKQEDPKLEIQQACSNVDMAVLNTFTTFNPDVQPTDEGFSNPKAAWKKMFYSFEASCLNPTAFFSRIFKDSNFVRQFGKPASLEIDFFHVVSAMECIGADALFWGIFSFDELCKVWESDNYLYYMSKGPDTTFGGRQWTFAWTLAQNILDCAHEDIPALDGKGQVSDSPDYVARLRFGHDTIIMSLLTLLRADGWCTPATSPENVKDVWNDFNIPMAANLQMIFYRNRQGDILVRTMLNEKDLTFPVKSDCAPYYRWSDFEAHCKACIAHAQVIIANTKAPE